MSSLRLRLLLGGLLLGSCSLLIQNIGVARCDNLGEITCVDDLNELECVDGLEKQTPCETGETCVPADGCVDLCGNGAVDGSEECDGNDLGGQDCQSVTGFPNGALGCAQDCTFDTSACFGCGDGIANNGEECDDGNNDDNDGCNAQCQLEKLIACIPPGNLATFPEFCDGDDLRGKECVDFGFQGGELDCNNQCGFETDNCDPF